MIFPETHQGYPLTVRQVAAPQADVAAFEPKGRCLSKPLFLTTYFVSGSWFNLRKETRHYELTVKLPII